MLSGAIGLQIIARRLGVELGEQQFNKFNNIDTRELTFKEIKKLTSDHSLVCRALKTNSNGLAAAVKKQPVLAQLKSERYVIVLKFSDGINQKQTVTIIDPKASNPKAENIDIDEFNSVWNGTGLIFKKSRRKDFAFNESQPPLAKQKQAEKRKEVLAEVHPLLVQKLGMQVEVQQASRN